MARRWWLVGLCLWAAGAVAHAGPYRWLSEFTDGSSPELAALHAELLEPRLGEGGGIPVRDVHWSSEFFDLHLEDGTLYLERPVRGEAVGAYFRGEAEVRFTPRDRKASQDLVERFGEGGFGVRRTRNILFFSLREASLFEELGLGSSDPAPGGDEIWYAAGKEAMGQLGTTLVHSFLNRQGAGRNTVYVLFDLQEVRTQGSEDALLLYSLDPTRRQEVQLSVAGHREVQEGMPHKMYFRPVAWCRAVHDRFRPPGRVAGHFVDLKVGTGKYSAEEASTIVFTPSPGFQSLRFAFTPRLEVEAVEDASGAELPFLQWANLEANPNYDQNVIVQTGALHPGTEQRVTFRSSGSLFEPWLTLHYLRSEDLWTPLLDDREGSRYDLEFQVPGTRIAVAAGTLLEQEDDGESRRYHFRTERPIARSTLYFGDFLVRSVEAESLTLEAYVARSNLQGRQSLDTNLEDLAGAVDLFTDRFGPLDHDILRVAGIPTGHGRGFDGLILLGQSRGYGNTTTGATLFRAHEVAHQWWGNLVQPRDWPEDRWLSESLASLSAMERYRQKYPNPERIHEQIYLNWVRPVLETSTDSWKNLVGDRRRGPWGERFALIDGQGNVYTKGPAVLHMLRYLYRVRSGDDERFWVMLREFLDRYRHRQVGTSEFVSLVEEHLGEELDWFWDQWLYGRSLPAVRWSRRIEARGEGWEVTVDARQTGTAFRLAIPVTLHFGGGRSESHPLWIEGASGRLTLEVTEKPRKVTINDGWESLVSIRG